MREKKGEKPTISKIGKNLLCYNAQLKKMLLKILLKKGVNA
jgi:hypothetical protein